MVVKLFLTLILLCRAAYGADILDEFEKKDYSGVHRIYQENPSQNFSRKELIMISYSLQKLKFYRQDVKLNVRLIKKEYNQYHRRVLKQIEDGDTIDSDQYPEALKVLYWNLMNAYGSIILSYEDHSKFIKKDHEHYLVFAKILSEFEFREGKVDKLNDRISAHILLLQNKVYKFSRSISFQYISWQQESKLEGPSGLSTNLTVTNRGFCLGGDMGYENASYHWYVNGCAFFGSGGVAADSGSGVNYKQSNIPAYGLKFGPGVSAIVSSTKSRVGLRIPIVYNVQTLQNPGQDGFNIDPESAISIATALYSRWQFDKWYLESEFGKYVDREATIWTLGIGRQF